MCEYGNTLADVNSLVHWQCPHPGCERSYEPLRFGYFWFPRGMGSRTNSNPVRQCRCNRHDELPFLYIGKSGRSRQFLCPFFQCNERGEVVAISVPDEDEPSPEVEPVSPMSNEERKRNLEMTAFRSFTSVSGLVIDEGSVTNEQPPKPDIRCTISGKPRWFEMAQIISEKVAANINLKGHASKRGFSFNQEDPFVDVVRKKLTKRYETGGAPVDLILHFNLRLGKSSVVRNLIQRYSVLLDSLVSTGPFARVWIFDEWRREVIWSGSGVNPKTETVS